MRQKSYGDLVLSLRFERFASAVRLDWEHNLDVTARILLNGDFTFCPIYDFNSKRRIIQLRLDISLGWDAIGKQFTCEGGR